MAQSILENPTEKLVQKKNEGGMDKKKKTRAGGNKPNYRAIQISKVVKDKANLIWKGRKLQLQGGEFIER